MGAGAWATSASADESSVRAFAAIVEDADPSVAAVLAGAEPGGDAEAVAAAGPPALFARAAAIISAVDIFERSAGAAAGARLEVDLLKKRVLQIRPGEPDVSEQAPDETAFFQVRSGSGKSIEVAG